MQDHRSSNHINPSCILVDLRVDPMCLLLYLLLCLLQLGMELARPCSLVDLGMDLARPCSLAALW
jgi:hypothetical protein